ncbi:unnamed protein product [Choristocarpus tenellus]
MEIEADRSLLRETLKRETDARGRVGEMLKGYKDEVETLNEALKIAAMDIAAARVTVGSTPSDIKSTLSGEEGEGDTNSTIGHGSGEVKDEAKVSGGDGGGDLEGSGRLENRERIFVFEDGTYEKR